MQQNIRNSVIVKHSRETDNVYIYKIIEDCKSKQMNNILFRPNSSCIIYNDNKTVDFL